MGLRNFHLIFIVVSILLAFYFSFWCYQYSQTHQAFGYLITSIAALITGIGLLIYGVMFTKKVKAQ